MPNRSHILVAGGAGYVGSHCVAALLDRGHAVTVLDDLSRGHREAVPPGAELVVGGLGDREALAWLFAGRRFDAVMHFAARSLVGESMRDPHAYLHGDVVNAMNLVQAMMRAGVGRLVFSSSAAVYGTPGGGPVDEDAPAAPESPYGEAKHMVERLLHWADRCHGLRSARLRYFNAAGAHPDGLLGEDHEPETHLIPLALDAAAGRRPPLDIHGDDYPTPDGTCVRDYVHVCDLADAHLLALDALDGGSRTYNLGSGRGHSVRETLAAVERVTGRAVPARVGPRRPGDPAVLVASSERIRRELGWRPRFPDIDDIVRTAWEWRRPRPRGYASAPPAMAAE
jgi:UDP-glucose 4-epimerase